MRRVWEAHRVTRRISRPPVADDPNAPPVSREISRLDNAIEKVVVSDTLTPGQTAPWQDATRILRRTDAHAEIAALK